MSITVGPNFTSNMSVKASLGGPLTTILVDFPTGKLRWRRGTDWEAFPMILQQEIETKHNFDNGYLISKEYEWRDVPVEDGP